MKLAAERDGRVTVIITLLMHSSEKVGLQSNRKNTEHKHRESTK